MVESIIRCRKAKGKYTSFPDFLDKVEAVVCNKRTVESLIKAGAFDEMGHTRKGLTAHYEPMIDNVVAVKRKEAEGQFDLFGGMGDEESDEPGLRARRRVLRRRVGQVLSARPGARDARPVRLRPPALRPRARPHDKADAAIAQLTGGDTPTARSSPSAASSPASSAR